MPNSPGPPDGIAPGRINLGRLMVGPGPRTIPNKTQCPSLTSSNPKPKSTQQAKLSTISLTGRSGASLGGFSGGDHVKVS